MSKAICLQVSDYISNSSYVYAENANLVESINLVRFYLCLFAFFVVGSFKTNNVRSQVTLCMLYS